MRRVTGTEGNNDYLLVAEAQGMWLAVKPFIVRTPISWSCVVGIRWRGGHSPDLNVIEPQVNGMAWNVKWQKANLDHASASFPMFGISVDKPCTDTEIMDALTDENLNKIVSAVCSAIDPRTRVHDFNASTLKGQFRDIIGEQAKHLPPGQDVPECLQHLPSEEIMQRIAHVLAEFLKSGAPDGLSANGSPYEKMGGPIGTLH